MPFIYDKITIPAGSGDFLDAAKMDFGFVAENVVVHFVSGAGIAEYSFDGKNAHGEAASATAELLTNLFRGIMSSAIWVHGSGAGGQVVQVFAWAN